MYWIDAYLSLFGTFSTAVSSIIGSIAWPAVLFILVLMFKRQIASALGTLRHLDLPGMKVDFGDDIAKVEAEADALPARSPASPPVAPPAPLLPAASAEAEGPGEEAPASTAQDAPMDEAPASSAPQAPAAEDPSSADTDAPADGESAPVDRAPSGRTPPSSPSESVSTDAGQWVPSPAGSAPASEVPMPPAPTPSSSAADDEVEWTSWKSMLLRTLPADPSALILRAWEGLYDEVVQYAEEAGVVRPDDKSAEHRNVRYLVSMFQLDRLLDRSATYLIVEMSDLRNQVAYGKHEPTSGEAITYDQSAEKLKTYISSQRQSLKDDGAPATAPAGWFPDGSGQLRYWDGAAWTQHVAPLTQGLKMTHALKQSRARFESRGGAKHR